MSEPSTQPTQKPFRAGTAQDFANMSESQREEAVKAWHAGTLQSLEKVAHQRMAEALAMPTVDGAPRRVEELVIVLMHVEDQVIPNDLRVKWMAQDPPVEVGVFVAERVRFAESVAQFSADGKTFPYMPAARVLLAPPPKDSTYATVFAFGKNTTFVVTVAPQPDAA